MLVSGHFTIQLAPGADQTELEQRLSAMGSDTAIPLRPTRITRHFSSRLLRSHAWPGRYVWAVDVDLMTDAGYRFSDNLEDVQARLEGLGVIVSLDTYVVPEISPQLEVPATEDDDA